VTAGVMGAAAGGVLCALAVLGKDPLALLQQRKKAYARQSPSPAARAHVAPESMP
jgi:hypothetical protein